MSLYLTQLQYVEQSAEEFNEACRSLVVFYILKAFTVAKVALQVGDRIEFTYFIKQAGIPERYWRLTQHLLGILTEAGYLTKTQDAWVVKKAWRVPKDMLAHYMSKYPEATVELTLLSRCGAQLGDILQGRVEALDLLFVEKDGISATTLYHQSPAYVAVNQELASAFKQFLQHYPKERPLRILEIGAGTGGTTSHLLPLLKNSGLVVDYIYTDISAGFFEGAQRQFADYDFVQYQVLDVEQSAALQGFAPGQYDLVIAANVLHATRCLTTTMKVVRELLVEGGYALLLEGTARSYFADLTFGLLDGWWRFNEDSLRPDYPLLSLTGWQQLLTSQGFSTCVVNEHQSSQSILLSQYVHVVHQPIEATQTWLLIHDAPDFAEAFKQRLGLQGITLLEARIDGNVSTESLLSKSALSRIIYASFAESAVELAVPAFTEERSVHLLQVIQGLIRYYTQHNQSFPAFDIVTNLALSGGELNPMHLANSALWGIGRSLQNEYIDWSVRLIDCDVQDGVESIAHALWVSSVEGGDENQLRLQANQLSVCRLYQVN